LTSGTLTLSGQTGSVVRWESSVSPFTTWTTIANTTTTYTSGALTQTTQFRAVVQSGSCASATSSATTVTVTTGGGNWLGSVSSSWKNASNWCGGVVPTAATDITIASGTPFSPVIDTVAIVNNLTINSGASVSFTGSGNSLEIKSGLTLTGTLSPANGNVIFGGTSAQTIPVLSYYDLTINGGSAKTLAGSTTVSHTLNLTSGTISLGTNNLTIASTGSIAGGSSTAFVVTDNTGKLVQNNVGPAGRSGTILFPVGSSTSSYTPTSIINTGTTDNYDVRVINQVSSAYSGGLPTGSPYTTHVVNKTWFINEAVAGGSTLTLTMQWNGSDELTSFNRASCGIARYNGTGWISGSTSAASGTNPYTQLTSNISTLTPFAIGDASSTVPVKLISFTAVKNKADVDVTWQTASEMNNDHFDIERSTDGKQFSTIGEQRGAGTSRDIIAYAFTDHTASQAFLQSNILYYRLKQVDIDGNYTYSDIVNVANAVPGQFEIVSVKPNPFASGFELNYLSSSLAPVTIEITDVIGKMVFSRDIQVSKGANTFTMPADIDLKDGVYFVRLMQNNDFKMVRVVKQN
jgi:hypothetical protein